MGTGLPNLTSKLETNAVIAQSLVTTANTENFGAALLVSELNCFAVNQVVKSGGDSDQTAYHVHMLIVHTGFGYCCPLHKHCPGNLKEKWHSPPYWDHGICKSHARLSVSIILNVFLLLAHAIYIVFFLPPTFPAWSLFSIK